MVPTKFKQNAKVQGAPGPGYSSSPLRLTVRAPGEKKLIICPARLFLGCHALVPIIFAAGYPQSRWNNRFGSTKPPLLCSPAQLLDGAGVDRRQSSLAVAGLSSHLGDLSQVLFFLMERDDHRGTDRCPHDGFEIITTRIHTRSRTRLTWILALLSFFFPRYSTT